MSNSSTWLKWVAKEKKKTERGNMQGGYGSIFKEMIEDISLQIADVGPVTVEQHK